MCVQFSSLAVEYICYISSNTWSNVEHLIVALTRTHRLIQRRLSFLWFEEKNKATRCKEKKFQVRTQCLSRSLKTFIVGRAYTDRKSNDLSLNERRTLFYTWHDLEISFFSVATHFHCATTMTTAFGITTAAESVAERFFVSSSVFRCHCIRHLANFSQECNFTRFH